jgi:small ligand-binding sensory domain FIST
MLLGDAILVPITEVGSVACAFGWSAACAACLALARSRPDLITLSPIERIVASVGLLVGIAMGLMKVIPAIPGHFTIYEWIALAAWIAVGAIAAASRTRRTQIQIVKQR